MRPGWLGWTSHWVLGGWRSGSGLRPRASRQGYRRDGGRMGVRWPRMRLSGVPIGGGQPVSDPKSRMGECCGLGVPKRAETGLNPGKQGSQNRCVPSLSSRDRSVSELRISPRGPGAFPSVESCAVINGLVNWAGRPGGGFNQKGRRLSPSLPSFLPPLLRLFLLLLPTPSSALHPSGKTALMAHCLPATGVRGC